MAERDTQGWLDRPVGAAFIVLVAALFAIGFALRQHDAWWLIPGGIAFAILAIVTLGQNRIRRRQASERRGRASPNDSGPPS